MAVLQQTFEGGTAGVEITSANSASGGNGVDGVKGAGASVAFTATGGEIIAGSMSAKCVGPAASAAYVNLVGSGTSGGFFAKFRLTSLPVQTTAIHIIRGSSKLAQVQFRTDGKLQFENSNGSQTYVTPNALTLPGVYWLDLAVDSGTTTSDGRMKFAVYNSSGTLTAGMPSTQEWTTTNTGGGISISFFQCGKANGSNDTQAYIVDDIRAVTGAYTFGQSGSGISPVANAGVDQTVEPWSTVTLSGSGSSDADGTIQTYTWTQTGGSAVTLGGSGANRTFTAPGSVAGSTHTFSLTVTDNEGLTSSADSVTVTVLGAAERTASSGSLVTIEQRQA